MDAKAVKAAAERLRLHKSGVPQSSKDYPPAQELADMGTLADAYLVLAPAVKAHEADGHVYGKRPCSTCEAITKALGEPFGCDLFRLQKALARR